MTACIAPCRAALELFNCNEASFKAPQLEQLDQSTPEQLRLWKKLNAQVHQDVEVGLAPRRRPLGSGVASTGSSVVLPSCMLQVEKKEINVTVSSGEPVPGFLKLDKQHAKMVLKASYRPVRLRQGSEGRERDLTLITVRH